MRLLHRIFPLLPINTRRTLVQAMVISRLDYENALLTGVGDSVLSKLQVVQNTVARLVLNRPAGTPSAPLLKELHWLPIKKHSFFKICSLTYHALRGKGPRYLQRKLITYIPGHNLRSSTQALLCVPRMRQTRTGCKAFSYLTPAYWNKLPKTLRETPTYCKFRKLLKAFLYKFSTEHIKLGSDTALRCPGWFVRYSK